MCEEDGVLLSWPFGAFLLRLERPISLRNFKQGCRQFFVLVNIPQLSSSVLSLPLGYKIQVWVDPHRRDGSGQRGALVLYFTVWRPSTASWPTFSQVIF